jgi:hypothetical protein
VCIELIGFQVEAGSWSALVDGVMYPRRSAF